MKFYRSFESMKSNPPPYRDPFILQWEIPNPKDQLERLYVVFDGMKEYSRYLARGRYNTCHEVLIPSSFNPEDDIVGHPAFDLDFKPDSEGPTLMIQDGVAQFPDGWLRALEKDIVHVLRIQYPSFVDDINPRFVWMTSPSTSKASKHLVVQGITFNMWHVQMKILIKGLKRLGGSYLTAIDDGIYRRLGSLRLPLNSKKPKDGIPQSRLGFDDPSHGFKDGLIIVRDETIQSNDLLLWPSHLHPSLQEEEMVSMTLKPSYPTRALDPGMEGSMERAWSLVESRYHTGLELGMTKGSYAVLNRIQPGMCPISGKMHDRDNAYLFTKGPLIFYACHRGCSFHVGSKEYKAVDITSHNISSANIDAHSILSTMKDST